MKRNWKRYLGLIIIAGMLISLTACSSGGSASSKPAESTAAETEVVQTGEEQEISCLSVVYIHRRIIKRKYVFRYAVCH